MRNFYGTFSPGRRLRRLFLFLREIFACNCFIGHQLQLQPRAGSICEFLTNQKAFIFLFTRKQRELISFLSLSYSVVERKICHHLIRFCLQPVGAVGSMDLHGGFASPFKHPIMAASRSRLLLPRGKTSFKHQIPERFVFLYCCGPTDVNG